MKKANLINDVADTIALIPDAVIRAVYVKSCADKFGIDEQILTDRVTRSRNDMILADRKQAEREAARARQGSAAGYVRREQYPVSQATSESVPPVRDDGYMPPMPDDYIPGPEGDYMPMDQEEADYAPSAGPQVQQSGILVNDPYLEPCERDLLKFILEDGCTPLEFDRDSKFYVEGEVLNVAEFIDGILAEDEVGFENLSYRKVYDEYFAMYDEGLTQEQIQTRLLNSMDEQVSAVARELLIEKYQITVKNYEQSLTATATRLVQFVPKTLMTYQCKRVEQLLKKLTAELSSATDETAQLDLLMKISEYSKARTRLNNELGRV